MCVGVGQNVLKWLVLSWWRHRCDVTTTFSINDVIFSMTSHSAQIAQISQVSYVTKMSHDVIQFKHWTKKCSDFRKWLRKTSKIEKVPVTVAVLNFQELFVMSFDSKSSWFRIKVFFLKRFITKKPEGNKFLSCKIGLNIKKHCDVAS